MLGGPAALDSTIAHQEAGFTCPCHVSQIPLYTPWILILPICLHQPLSHATTLNIMMAMVIVLVIRSNINDSVHYITAPPQDSTLLLLVAGGQHPASEALVQGHDLRGPAASPARPTRQRFGRLAVVVQPADCNHHNYNHTISVSLVNAS